MKPNIPLITLASLALAVVPATSATTIYSETFSNGSLVTPTTLHGSTPDITTGGNTWIASTGWQENGSTATIATSGGTSADNSAFLAFSPTAGNIYTLSATMTVPTGGESTGWVALGFTADDLTGNFFGSTNNASPWVLYRPDTNVDSFQGLGTSNPSDEGNHAISALFAIVLNTQTTNWTAEWLINSVSVRTATYDGLSGRPTNPTITHVGFGRENGNTSGIDNFTLTVVPEPSTALLGGLGLLALLRRRRN